METKESLFEPVLERAEHYTRNRVELLKLKTVDKASEIGSGIFVRLLFAVVFLLFVFALNIAAALWIGDLLGKSYYGFLVISGFYAFVAIVLLLLNPKIKASVQNSIIKQLLN